MEATIIFAIINIIMACALVIVTGFYVHFTNKLVGETKRLVDLNQRHFRISNLEKKLDNVFARARAT